VPHSAIVTGLIETLDMRRLEVVRDEYAVTDDGMRMFGFLEISVEESGVRFAIGCRNSHDKSFSMGLTVGYRVFVCDNMAFNGDFTPVLAKHSKHFNLLDALAIGVDRMQRNFEPMRKQIEGWQAKQLTDGTAKNIIYDAFLDDDLALPRHLLRPVHNAYFDPQYPEFQPRTIWSLTNAFTTALKTLDPVPQFKATAKLGQFFAALN
jgi:hypothetical protein